MKPRKVPLLVLLALVACTLGVLPGCLPNQSNAVPPSPQVSGNAVQSPPSIAESFDTKGAKDKSMASSTRGSAPLSLPSGGSTSRKSETSARPDASHQRLPDQSQKPVQQEQAIQNSLNRLAIGAFFYTVPNTMQANQPEIIKAGITPKFTEQLRKELQGQGEVFIKQNVRYDPTGVAIQLKASPEDFYIDQISGGKQAPIVDGKSVIWTWKVTPLKQGTHYLNLTATVDLSVPEQEWKYSKEIVIYKEPINVQSNVGYSLQQFVLNYGLQVVIGVIAILFGLFAWWKGLRPRRRIERLQHPQ